MVVAKLFWNERKIEKTRTWFTRAITINPDLGDAWGYLYKFELVHGNDDSREDLIKKCVTADPRHGEVWTSVSKDLENIDAKTEEVLKKVAAKLPNPLNQ